jgi:hypothetical protein
MKVGTIQIIPTFTLVMLKSGQRTLTIQMLGWTQEFWKVGGGKGGGGGGGEMTQTLYAHMKKIKIKKKKKKNFGK